MTSFDLNAVLEKATVPEHSVPFMQAMSGGEPFLVRSYLFIAAHDWLLAVGYPLLGDYSPETFDQALAEALRRTGARDCWAICPSLPARLRIHCQTQDCYHLLPADAVPPRRLERLAERAAASLRVEEGRTFTAAHRRLWAEFTGRVALPPNVRELFAQTEEVLPRAPGLSLLNAWDREGHLAACLVLDTAPRRFVTYLIGAHSRVHYTAHASDLLFLEMIRAATRRGKDFLHLGLGVNEGIRRFKTKWGGKPVLAYEMASWREQEGIRQGLNELMRMLASRPAQTMSKREYLASLPSQRRFAMLWEMEKNGRRSWIGGTAHFFCYSFEFSLRDLFDRVDTVLFEGPLDEVSLDQVSQIGRSPEPGTPRLIDAMTEEDLRRLERVVCGPKGRWARLLGLQSPDQLDVRFILSETRPWMAFFSLWASYLARQGWTQSVDLEAWHLARDMGKAVRGMETVAEQVETLESIPVPRIVNFFRRCGEWNRYIKRNVRAYLRGDLEAMLGTSIEFPSRTEMVITRRDARFLDRMAPFLEEGRCAIFVGSAHILNLRKMLTEAGFSVRRCP
ncbi:MAG: GNAT family N-acetyltransferase [Nitrospirota bacterium]